MDDINDMDPDDPDNTVEEDLTNAQTGQHFHMDFGFVRGSGYRIKQEKAPNITSVDGFNSYFIIVDRVTIYIWIILTASKAPPVTIPQRILNEFKCNNTHRTVRTDQGKELGRSSGF